MRRALDTLTRLVARLRRQQVYRPAAPVKLNLGSGLTVAPGWVNIDSSLNALAAKLPKPFLFLTYKLSSAQRWYSFSGYVRLLKDHEFIHYDLCYGIPFVDRSVDCIYSAHFFEHLSPSDGERLFRETRRVLKPHGVLRVNVPDAEDSGYGLEKDGGWYSQHRCMYDWSSLEAALKKAGFTEIIRCENAKGSVSDLEILEGRRSPNGLYVEARAS
jgi:SAM-dependent methyltransferase